jgi:hypothetical protein
MALPLVKVSSTSRIRCPRTRLQTRSSPGRTDGATRSSAIYRSQSRLDTISSRPGVESGDTPPAPHSSQTIPHGAQCRSQKQAAEASPMSEHVLDNVTVV